MVQEVYPGSDMEGGKIMREYLHGKQKVYQVPNSKVIIVVQKWIESSPDAPLTMYVERCFLSENAANKWILEQNPKHPEWFDYVCPSEGTRESHTYAIDFTVLEEE